MAKKQPKRKSPEKPYWHLGLQKLHPWDLTIAKAAKIIIFTLLLVLYSSIILHKFQLPTPLDMPTILREGQIDLHHGIIRSNYFSYTQPNTPYVNYYWLSSIIFYLVFSLGGWVALNILGLAMLLAAFSIVFMTARRFADFYLVALLSLPAVLILGIRSDVRPEMFSYLFFSLFLLFLYKFKENPDSNKIWWLVPIQIIWVNTHLFFVLGPALVTGFLVEQIILKPRQIKSNPLVKKLALLLLAVCTVCLVNPFGLSGAVIIIHARQWTGFINLPLQISENESIKEFLREFPGNVQPAVELFIPAVVILAGSFAAGFRNKRRPYLLLALSAGVAVLGYSNLRGLALFGYVFLLAAAVNFNGLFIKLKIWLTKIVPKPAVMPVLALLAFSLIVPYLLVANQKKFQANGGVPGVGLAPMSTDSANFFINNKLKGPIFNDVNIGSYLIYYLFPKEKVYSDNRLRTAYTNSFFIQYTNDFKDNRTWQTDLKRYKFNTIFLYQYEGVYGNFLYDRYHDPDWALVYTDRYSLIYVKNTLANQKVINQYKITPDNVQSRMQFLTNSNDPNDQISAADIFNLVGRTDLAFQTDSAVVNKWPSEGKIWFTLGSWLLISNNTQQAQYNAIIDIQKAIKQGYTTSQAYTFLGIAHYKVGQHDAARVDAQKALKINPDNQDAKDLLKIIGQSQ